MRLLPTMVPCAETCLPRLAHSRLMKELSARQVLKRQSGCITQIRTKFFVATFPVQDGRALEEGSFVIPGVSGSGACIRLDYLDPGGALTGKLLPSGNRLDRLQIEGVGEIDVSLVDAFNPVVYVRAVDLGRTALEPPEELDADKDLMAKLDQIRRAGGVVMGLANAPAEVPLSNPKVAMVGEPGTFSALDGSIHAGSNYDIAVRIVSMGNVHRAVTLTGAMCVATAVRIDGTIPNEFAAGSGTTLVGNPSGLLPVEADVRTEETGELRAVSTTTYRTQRRIMEGAVLYPKRLLNEQRQVF